MYKKNCEFGHKVSVIATSAVEPDLAIILSITLRLCKHWSTFNQLTINHDIGIENRCISGGISYTELVRRMTSQRIMRCLMSMMRWNGLREQSESAGQRTQGGDPSSNIIKAVILTTTYTTKYKSRGTTNIIVCGGILLYYKQYLPSFHDTTGKQST